MLGIVGYAVMLERTSRKQTHNVNFKEKIMSMVDTKEVLSKNVDSAY